MINRLDFKNRKWEYLLVLAVFLLLFVMNCFTPLLVDDYTFSYSLVSGEPIGSLSELVASLDELRNLYNGRVVAHAIVQLLLMMPKAVFNVLNALHAVLLMYLGLRFYYSESSGKNAFMMLLYALLVWNFLPAFGHTFVWLDGSVNYSWGISFMLLYLWPFAACYMEKTGKLSAVKQLLFFLVSFIAGAYSENGSIAIIFMAFCLLALIFAEKKKIPLYLLIAFVISLVGFVFLMSAPSESGGRAAEISVSVIANNIKTIIESTKDRLLPLYCLYAVLLVLGWTKLDRKQVYISIIMVLGGIGSLAAFSFAVYFTNRHFCFTVMFLVIACVMLLSGLFEEKNKGLYKALAAVLAVLFMFNLFIGGIDILATYKDHMERVSAMSYARENGIDGLVLPILQSGSEYCAASGYYDLSEDAGTWPNPDFARYYGLDWVMGDLPE